MKVTKIVSRDEYGDEVVDRLIDLPREYVTEILLQIERYEGLVVMYVDEYVVENY